MGWQLHQQVAGPVLPRGEPAVTPLQVESQQLQGPITSGVLSFCFEGARWQFFSPIDLAFRVALGSLSAFAVSGNRMPAFAGATVLCGCFFPTTLFHAPYICFSENVVLLLLQLSLAICALAHLGHTAGTFDPEVCNGFVLFGIAC